MGYFPKITGYVIKPVNILLYHSFRNVVLVVYHPCNVFGRCYWIQCMNFARAPQGRLQVNEHRTKNSDHFKAVEARYWTLFFSRPARYPHVQQRGYEIVK